ncbi:MAG: phage major capsid protein [Solirubrobacteraceae bacterium]
MADVPRLAPFALRAVDDAAGDAGDDGRTLDGYAAVFGRETIIDSWEGRFRETIAPGSMKKSFRESPPIVQFDHGRHTMIGSIPIASVESIREEVDPDLAPDGGAHVVARLHDNWLVAPVRDAIASGAISGMSFRFSVVRDEWHDKDGKKLTDPARIFEALEATWLSDVADEDLPVRTLREVRVAEVGPVVWPAYADTSVSVRSIDLERLDDPQQRDLLATAILHADLAGQGDPPTPPAAPPATRSIERAGEHSAEDNDAPRGTPSGAAEHSSPSNTLRARARALLATQPKKESIMADSKIKQGDKQAPSLNLAQTRAQMADRRAELEVMAERGNLTDEEEAHFQAVVEEHDALVQHERALVHAEQLDRIRAATRATAPNRVVRAVPADTAGDGMDRDPMGDARDSDARGGANPWDLSTMRHFGVSPEDRAAELHSRARSAIEAMPGASDSVRKAATQILEASDDPQGTFARQVLASSSPEYVRAWSKHARGQGHELTAAEQRAMSEVRAMSLTDANGGYLVPFQLDPTVIITSDGSYNEIRQIARTVVATGNEWAGVSSDAVTWSWDGEADQVSDDATTFAQPKVKLHKAQGFVPISIEALADASNVTTEVGRLLAQGKDDLESKAFITGAGDASKQPTGIVTALTGTPSIVLAAADDTFALSDVHKVFNALPARYRQRAAWLGNNSIYGLVRGFGTTPGAFWTDLNGDRPPLMLGKPAREAEEMDGTITTVGAVANYALIVGDFSNYVIADRVGMTVEFIPHLFGMNQRPTGQRGWYAYYRVGADSVNDKGFRMLNVASAA